MKTKETSKARLIIIFALLCVGLFAIGLLTNQKGLSAHAQNETFSKILEENNAYMTQEQPDIFSENMDEQESDMSPDAFDPPLLNNCSEPINKPNGTSTSQDTYAFALGDMTMPNPSWPSPFNNIENSRCWYQTWPGMIRGLPLAQTHAPEETLTLQQKRDQLNKLANLVKDDLIFLGKTVTGGYLMKSNDEYDYDRINYGDDNHIAIRIYGMMNYYFMRFENNWGEWRHKPSHESVILRLGQSHTYPYLVHDKLVTTMSWYDEQWTQVSEGGLEHHNSNWEYPGEIYIVSYRDNSWETSTSDGGVTSITDSTQLYDTANIPQKVLINHGGYNTGVLGPTITNILSIGNHSSLKELHIPYTINNISAGAFNELSNLEKVVLHNEKYYTNDCGVLFERGVAGSADELIFIPPKSSGTFSYNGLTIQNRTVISFTPQAGFSGNSIIPEGITTIANSAFANQTELDKITIPSSVISIGDYAFQNCEFMYSVTFASGSRLQSIGERAFENCEFLGWVVGINLPASIENIGTRAFSNCSKLARVTFATGSKLENIGEYAFYNNLELEEVQIPASVKTINEGAFFGCSRLYRINFDSGGQLEIIGSNTFFHCTRLSRINIPASVEEIQDAAFMGCTALSSLTFENGSQLTKIGDLAFSGCTSLDRYAQDPVVIPAGVTSIGAYAFSGCTNAYSISIPNTVISIGTYAFNNCLNFSRFYIPNSVTTIGIGVFNGWTASQTIHVIGRASKPAGWNSSWKQGCNAEILWNTSVIQNDIFAFRYINDYTAYEISIGENVYRDDIPPTIDIPASFGGLPVIRIADQGFALRSYFYTVNIPSSIQTIGHEAFYYSFDLTTINFAAGSQLTIIKDKAFFYTELISITIPASVTSIGNNVFSYCKNLANINVASGNNYYSSNGGVLFNKNRTTLVACPPAKTGAYTIPSSVETIKERAFSSCDRLTSISIPSSKSINIGDLAFSGCSGLTSLSIPSNVISIGEFAFSGCNKLASIAVASTNNYYSSNNGALLNKNQTIFMFCPPSKAGTYTVPSSVEAIKDRAFSGCNLLTSITIPASVANMGDYTFNGCSGLISITFGSNSGLTRIGEFAFSGCSSLTGIVIPNNVTNIDKYAFNACSDLAYVTLSNNLASIGDGAFESCRVLQSIAIPDSVVYLGEFIFAGCWGITSVTLPSNMTIIPDGLFFYCSGLKSITIPAGVTSIGEQAFTGCGDLICIEVEGGNSYFSDEGNCLIRLSDNTLILGCRNSIIPDYVESIGDYAFSGCKGLTSIEIPDSVISIGSHAFYNCSDLVNVTMSKNVTNIGDYAFDFCRKLTNITLPNSVTSIGYAAFSWCESLTSITIPNSVVNIGNWAFDKCDSLTIYTEWTSRPAGWSSYWNYLNRPIVWSCTLSTDKTYVASFMKTSSSISNSSTTLSAPYRENYDFGGWYANPSFTGTSYTAAGIVSAPNNVRYYTKWVPQTWSVTFDLNGGSGNFPTLSVNKNDTVNKPATNPTKQGHDFKCWALSTELTKEHDWNAPVKGNITLVALWEVSPPNPTDGLKYTLINSGTAYEVSKGTANTNGAVVIPSTYNGLPVLSIASSGFSNCSGLTSIIIPISIIKIGQSAFSGTGIWNNTANNSVVYAGKWAVGYKGTLGIVNFITDTVGIGSYAFSGCKNLTGVTIPSNVKNIGDDAFYSSGLASVTFEANSQLVAIGRWAFGSCNLTSVALPSSVINLGDYAFYHNRSLADVTFASNSQLSIIGANAFYYCSGLASIAIPDSVTSIGSSAFSSCSNLTSITFGTNSQLASIGSSIFSSCSKLTSITIPSGVTNIDSSAFSGCTGLTNINVDAANSIYISSGGILFNKTQTTLVRFPQGKSGTYTIPNSVTNIGNSAFSGCSGLTSITIPNSVTSIGSSAFSSCSGLTNITIQGNITSIEYDTFFNCSGLTSITIPNGVESIGSSAFARCSGLTSITIPASVTSIGNSAFSYCGSLAGISVDSGNPVYRSEGNCIIRKSDNTLIFGCKGSIIPASVTSIGPYAFQGSGLTSIVIPYNVTSIGSWAFASCSSLTSVTIGSGVVTIADYTFYNSGLTSIEIPASVTSIGSSAFYFCTSLKSVTFAPNSSLTTIGDSAFSNSYSLMEIIIPDSVTYIGYSAFSSCSSLAAVNFGEGSQLETIGDSAFSDCYSLLEITIPGSVTYVGAYAFQGWDYYQTIYIQDINQINLWDSYWNADCYAQIICGYSLEGTPGLDYNYIYDDYGNPGYEVSVGESVDNGYTFIVIPEFYEGIPVIKVADYGFYDCYEMTGIIIPSNVTRIGEYAFYDCHNLMSVIFSGVSQLESIDAYTFYNCHSLISINIPGSVIAIQDSAFAYCYSLISITMPETVEYIEANAFEGCYDITIYTEAAPYPYDWHFLWYDYNYSIIWECTLSPGKDYVVSIVTSPENIYYYTHVVSAPHRDGYIFGGWTTIEGSDYPEYMAEDIMWLPDGMILYAIWIPA